MPPKAPAVHRPGTLPTNLADLADIAINAIKNAASLDEVRDIKDRFAAFKILAKRTEAARTAANACARVVVAAIRAEGEALSKIEKAKGGRPGKTPDPRVGVSTLEQLGISHKESARAQRIASIPDDVLQQHFAQTEMAEGEITVAAVLRLVPKPKTTRRWVSFEDPVTGKPLPAAENRKLVEEFERTGGTLCTPCGIPVFEILPKTKPRKLDVISPVAVADLPTVDGNAPLTLSDAQFETLQKQIAALVAERDLWKERAISSGWRDATVTKRELN